MRLIGSRARFGVNKPLAVFVEMYPDAAVLGANRLAEGLINAVNLHTVLSVGERALVENNNLHFAYFAIPDAADVHGTYPNALDENAPALLNSIKANNGGRVWRMTMPEFDQGGGSWATGRPSLTGLTDQQAFDTWTNYYKVTKALNPEMATPASTRGYKIMALCVFGFSTYYAYEMGVDSIVLERNIDELADMTVGIAQVRGAARQYGGREWGIDLSTWKYWNDRPTEYDTSDELIWGWSTSIFKRHYYAAYMAGSDLIHQESVVAESTGGGGGLNPFGETWQDFYDFAMVRHPNRGQAHVPIAIMQNHLSGFEPKLGEWLKYDYKWYFANLYNDGDRMLERTLATVFPNYASWGTIVPGAPWRVESPPGTIDVSATMAAYRAQIAADADVRPWEPVGSTRYGHAVDVITDAATLSTLAQYQIVFLSTAQVLTAPQLAELDAFVYRGGILIINAKQMSAGAATLAGVSLGSTSSASASTWTADSSTVTEGSSFNYRVVTLGTATNVATASGNPIITQRIYGAGKVYAVMPDWALNATGTTFLLVVRKLLDELYASVAKAVVTGADCSYLVNTNGIQTIVTIINTSLAGTAWTGTISWPLPGVGYTVREWVGDTVVSSSVVSGRVQITANVPGYDVHVYVLDPTSAVPVNRLTGDSAGFEAGIGIWSGHSNATAARSTAQAATGVASLAVTITATADASAGTDFTTSGPGFFAVTPGQAFTLSVKGRAATTPRQFAPEIIFYTAANAGTWHGVYNVPFVFNTTSGWTTCSGGSTVPAGAAYARVNIYFSGPAAGEVHYIDDVEFVGGQ